MASVHAGNAEAVDNNGSEKLRDTRASATVVAAAGGRESDAFFIPWESAKELVLRGPYRLKKSLALDIPALSKDLWTADLIDIGRTSVTSSQ